MPNDNRVFPAGTGGNPTAPQIGSVANLVTTAQPPIRPPPDPFVLKSVEPFTDDDDIPGFVDGQGNRTWYVDTSASAKAITFVSAGESVEFEYTVKWVKGANALTVKAASGNVGGTTTYAGVSPGDAYIFKSDGTEYHLFSKAGDFVTSASLATALSGGAFSPVFNNITITGSSTFSGTAQFLTAAMISGTLSVGTLVVSGTASFSGTVAIGTLVVSGTASFSATVDFNSKIAVSATASVGFLTVGGAQLGRWEYITVTAITNVAGTAAVSGSWTAYSSFEVFVKYAYSATGATSGTHSLFFYISTDNGTTRHLQSMATGQNVASESFAAEVFYRIMGNGSTHSGFKVIHQIAPHLITLGAGLGPNNSGAAITAVPGSTSTANTGIINEIGLGPITGTATKTLSAGWIELWGYRRSAT